MSPGPVISKVLPNPSRLLPRRSNSGSKELKISGRRRALLIGINYQWKESEEFRSLKGSINDVLAFKDLLIGASALRSTVYVSAKWVTPLSI